MEQLGVKGASLQAVAALTHLLRSNHLTRRLADHLSPEQLKLAAGRPHGCVSLKT
jgi:hypothetical protein